MNFAKAFTLTLLTLVLTSASRGQTGINQFNFSSFKIMKGQLGKIKIGMTIKEAEKQFTGLTKQTKIVAEFSFDDESPAHAYYLGKEMVFVLIPKYNTDTLLYIIATHKNLKTTNGLNPKSTVSELLQKYPDLTVVQDLMSGGEVFSDEKNNWEFRFKTERETEIGVYPIAGNPSKPKRLNTKAEWIMIGK